MAELELDEVYQCGAATIAIISPQALPFSYLLRGSPSNWQLANGEPETIPSLSFSFRLVRHELSELGALIECSLATNGKTGFRRGCATQFKLKIQFISSWRGRDEP